jgi:hypothetical protein
MKLTIRDILGSRGAIEPFLSVTVDALLAYKMSRNLRMLRYEIRDAEQAQNDLFKKYGEMQPTGQYRIKPEHIEAFTAEHEAFQDGEVDVDIRPVSISKYAGKQIPQLVTDTLWFLFEDESSAMAPEVTKS